jgi:DNA-binding PadR family transcriptional regulator
MTDIDTRMLDRERKKGSAELIILSIVEPRARHGYEIGKLIRQRDTWKTFVQAMGLITEVDHA